MFLQEKRESSEVALTLEILKHGKRFHATVSFDTDTGLKQAISLVNDYNPLMKDFPINDLLSATELDKIRVSVQAIFSHLRKIRNTKYPIQRALRLVEAISRDLSNQLLKARTQLLYNLIIIHRGMFFFFLLICPGPQHSSPHVHIVRRVREGYQPVLGGLRHLGRRVRQAAGPDEGHCQEETRRAPQDGLEGQFFPQEAPGILLCSTTSSCTVLTN